MKGDGADCCIDMLDEEQTLGDASSIPLNAVDALNGRIARETGGVEDADAVALLQGVVADGLYADGAVDGQLAVAQLWALMTRVEVALSVTFLPPKNRVPLEAVAEAPGLSVPLMV